MKKLNVGHDASDVFLLSGELDRNNLNGYWLTRVEDIEQAGLKQPVLVDLSGITHSDTAGLAWIINLLRDCQTQNIQFKLRNVPDTLINLAKISDVEAFLPLQ